MKWNPSILSNNMFCTFLNFKKATEWTPEAYLFEIGMKEKHNVEGVDSGGKFFQDTQLHFILFFLVPKMYKVPLDFSRSLKIDLPMEWGRLKKIA